MGKIYTERQTTPLYNSTGEPGVGVEARRVAGYGRQLDAYADAYEKRAKETYSTALKIGATDTMNALYKQYSDDPVALENAFKKAYNKSIGEIADEDVKIDFMANVSLQSQSYITKAIENKKRKDYRIAKSMTFDGIDKNTEAMGIAFSTLLGSDFNPDNVAVYNSAMSANEQMINTLNDDGTFMFTDEQRKEKRKAMDRAHLLALKGNFNDLEPYQKENYMKLLAEDKIQIPVGVSEDKEIIMKNLQEIVSPESYEKFKDYAENVMKKSSKISKRDKALGGSKTPEQSLEEAIMQESNKLEYGNRWKGLEKQIEAKETDTIYDVFDYRNALQETFNNGGLDEKDYKNLMAKTIKPVKDLALKQKTSEAWMWNDSFKVGAFRINELMNMQNQNDEVRAAAYQVLYNNFLKYGIDPLNNDMNNSDSDTINKCVSETVKQLAVNNDPNLLGVNTQRVLTGTSMIDYNTVEQPKKAGDLNYVLKVDPKTKIVYKIFKNKDGSIDNNSMYIRIGRK